jgi:hypothetical protein
MQLIDKIILIGKDKITVPEGLISLKNRGIVGINSIWILLPVEISTAELSAKRSSVTSTP